MKTKSTLVLAVYLLLAAGLTAEERSGVFATVEQVLTQFAASRNNLNSSIVKSNQKCIYTYPGFKGTGVGYSKIEQRFDGNRYKSLWYLWGDINIKVTNVKEEDADYQSNLWDGQTAYVYSNGKNPLVGKHVSGVDIISSNSAKVCSEAFKRTTFGEIMGYHWGDDVRIDELFLQPSVKLQLQEKRETLHGVDCYVIEADVPDKGQYTVWIDPVHDFHIARVRVQRKTGDRIGDKTLWPDQTSNELYEVLEFEKTKDGWFPKKCTLKKNNHAKDYHATEDIEICFSKITLNPDHDKLGSFLPDDIPNGTKVCFQALSPDVEYVWRDGKAVKKKLEKGEE